MKVIFLDVDGVLNSEHWIKTRPWVAAPRPQSNVIDPEAIARLNRLITESGARVVLSSSWRLGRYDATNTEAVEQTLEALRAKGYAHDFFGATPRLVRTPEGEPRHRGHEIAAWIEARAETVESFVVLDESEERRRRLLLDAEVALRSGQPCTAASLLELAESERAT